MLKRIALNYTSKERAVEVSNAISLERAKNKHELEVSEQAYREARESLHVCQDELKSVRNKVRDQSEADMVFASIKIIAGALSGKTKNEMIGIESQQFAAQMQMQAMSSQSPLNAIGLGGLFGGMQNAYQRHHP